MIVSGSSFSHGNQPRLLTLMFRKSESGGTVQRRLLLMIHAYNRVLGVGGGGVFVSSGLDGGHEDPVVIYQPGLEREMVSIFLDVVLLVRAERQPGTLVKCNHPTNRWVRLWLMLARFQALGDLGYRGLVRGGGFNPAWPPRDGNSDNGSWE